MENFYTSWSISSVFGHHHADNAISLGHNKITLNRTWLVGMSRRQWIRSSIIFKFMSL